MTIKSFIIHYLSMLSTFNRGATCNMIAYEYSKVTGNTSKYLNGSISSVLKNLLIIKKLEFILVKKDQKVEMYISYDKN